MSIRVVIDKILNMAGSKNISVNVVKEIHTMVDGKKEMYETSTYTILKDGVYYIHYDR